MEVRMPRGMKRIMGGIDNVEVVTSKRKYKIDNSKLVCDTQGNVVYTDPHLFYKSLGELTHPYTKKKVKHLAPYQYEAWNDILNYDYNIFIKSNRMGLSTLCLMALFQNCLLKNSAGNEKLVVAQTLQMAKDHLYTLRQLILQSDLFRSSLIMRPGKFLLRDEITKVTQLFIHNPYNPARPTRIIGVGVGAATSVSWKNVDFIYCSDITKAAIDYTEAIDGAFTRLAISRGKFVIETIPRGPQGKVYSIYHDAINGKNNFHHHKYPIEMAIEAGLVSAEFIEEEKRRLGPFFPEYYGAEFISVGGNVFRPELIQFAIELAKTPQMERREAKLNTPFPKSMGIDPAFGSDSMFAIVITQLRNGVIEVIYAEEFNGMDHESMCNMISNMMNRYNVTKVYSDMQMQSVSDKLKQMKNDEVNPDENKRSIPFDQLRFAPYKINPVSFGRYGMMMVQHAQRIFSEKIISMDGLRFGNLVAQLKTATLINPSGERPELDKRTYGTMDLFDAFILSLVNYGFKQTENY